MESSKKVRRSVFIGKLVCVISFLLLLSACSSTPVLKIPTHPKQAWRQHKVDLSKMNHWRLSGVISVQQGRHVQSANIDWFQNDQHFSIELYGPLGLDAVKIAGCPGHAQLHRGHKFYRASSARALMNEILGWSIPISGARYWVRGLPVPDVPYHSQFNQYGLLSSLLQQKWSIQFLEYMVVNQYGLPALVRFKLGQNPLKITLAIDHWKIFQ